MAKLQFNSEADAREYVRTHSSFQLTQDAMARKPQRTRKPQPRPIRTVQVDPLVMEYLVQNDVDPSTYTIHRDGTVTIHNSPESARKHRK